MITFEEQHKAALESKKHWEEIRDALKDNLGASAMYSFTHKIIIKGSASDITVDFSGNACPLCHASENECEFCLLQIACATSCNIHTSTWDCFHSIVTGNISEVKINERLINTAELMLDDIEKAINVTEDEWNSNIPADEDDDE